MDNYDKPIQDAIKNLKSVRRPVPDEIDKDAFQKDLDKIMPLFDVIEKEVDDPMQAQFLQDMTATMLMMQRRYFNRSLWQITVQSLADQEKYIMGLLSNNDEEEMANSTFVTMKLAGFIAEHGLAMDCQDMDERFLAKMAITSPNVIDKLSNDTSEFDDDDLANEDYDDDFDLSSYDLDEDEMEDVFHGNNGLKYSEYSRSELLAIPVKVANPVDSELMCSDNYVLLNSVLDDLAQRYTPAQMKFLYSLCNTDKVDVLHITTPADAILNSMKDFGKTKKLKNLSLIKKHFEKQISYQATLDKALDFIKVIDDFMEEVQQLITIADADFQAFTKKIHDYLYGYLIKVGADNKHDVSDYLDKAKTRIDVDKVRKSFESLTWQPLQAKEKAVKVPQLTKDLDQHQVDLEIDYVKPIIEETTDFVQAENDRVKALVEKYEAALYEFHKIMVTDLNRRQKSWTEASIYYALHKLVTENKELANDVTFLRYFEMYMNGYADRGENVDKYMKAVRKVFIEVLDK